MATLRRLPLGLALRASVQRAEYGGAGFARINHIVDAKVGRRMQRAELTAEALNQLFPACGGISSGRHLPGIGYVHGALDRHGTYLGARPRDAKIGVETPPPAHGDVSQ